ncbi:MAG: AAA family ATPase, partial [Cystobacter sp.]
LIRGSARGPGLLTRRVRQQPFCVLLLDEIEKAHPAVFDLLLQVCGEGRLTDTQGQTTWFHNALIIMTSNLGVAHRRSPLGIGATQVDDTAHYLHEVHRHFRPEFVNRIDQLIAFHPLTTEQVEQVARLTVDKLARRRGLLQRGLSLEMPAELLSSLAAPTGPETHGARALRRRLDQRLVVPLARALSSAGAEVQGGDLSLHASPEGVSVRLTPGSPRQARQQLERVMALQSERREVDAILRMDVVERLVEQVHFLVAQLTQADLSRQGHEQFSLGQQHREHHRLDSLWLEVQELRASLSAAEELALLALFEQQDVSLFVDEAQVPLRALRRLLPSVLLALQPQRDGITLIVQEAGESRALDSWLLPLLEALPQRAWLAGGRLPAVRRHKGDPRRWRDEVLSSEALKQALGEPKRTFHEVLLSVSGAYAGSFLALEAGLHRFPSTDAGPVLLTVLPVAMSPHLTQKELELPAIAPPTSAPLKELRLMPTVRDHLPNGDILLHEGDDAIPLDGQGYFREWERVLLEHLLSLARAENLDPERSSSFVLDAFRGTPS